ncbi:MAG: sensor histidine kinase [Deferribacterales bacterium]
MKSNIEAHSSIYSDKMPDDFTASAAAEYFRLTAPAFCVIDDKGNILRSNTRFAKFFPEYEAALSFCNIKNLLTSKSFARLEKLFSTQTAGTKRVKTCSENGEKLPLKARVSPLGASEGRLSAVFFENDSKLKKLRKKHKKQEKLLIQQSKMAAIGEMLGVIAHQWKQPLNNLALIAQTIGDDFDHGDLNESAVEEHINAINSQILFMSSTVDDFRRFFIPQKTPQKFSVKKSAEEIISLMEPQLKTCNITASLHTDDDSTEIVGYINEFKQVILNLMVNAKDAVIQRRETDEAFRTEQGLIIISVINESGTCRISIRDNGSGISPKVMKKLFRPYFTTKNDNGTGIGLYLAKKIIEDKMHGKLTAEASASGALFTLSLPSAP